MTCKKNDVIICFFAEESLSTLYEAEEDSFDRSEEGEASDDDVRHDLTASSTNTVIHYKDDSLNDVDDITDNASVHNDEETSHHSRKKVYRR